MTSRIVFLKTGWMDYYDGRKSDTISGNFAHIKKFDEGHENLNFRKQGKYCYGYAPFNNKRLNLAEHLGSPSGADYVDDLSVVWISKALDARGVVVVGWYEHARLYAEYHGYGNGRVCMARALAADCTLLATDERWFRIEDAPRMTNIWYAHGRPELHRDVKKLIAGTFRPLRSKAKWRSSYHDNVLAVERAAVDAVWRKYEGKGFKVHSVEREFAGWDLVAEKGNVKFQLEVKGTAQGTVRGELTPNEYAMSIKHATYRICVVTNALTSPTIHIFRFSAELAHWVDETGKRRLCLEEIIAARFSA